MQVIVCAFQDYTVYLVQYVAYNLQCKEADPAESTSTSRRSGKQQKPNRRSQKAQSLGRRGQGRGQQGSSSQGIPTMLEAKAIISILMRILVLIRILILTLLLILIFTPTTNNNTCTSTNTSSNGGRLPRAAPEPQRRNLALCAVLARPLNSPKTLFGCAPALGIGCDFGSAFRAAV